MSAAKIASVIAWWAAAAAVHAQVAQVPAPAAPPASAASAPGHAMGAPGAPGYANPNPPPMPPAARMPAAPAAPLPPVSGLPADAPKVVINGGMYSGRKDVRAAIVNGVVVHEGADLGSGLTLQEIQPSGVVLGFRGSRYTVVY